MDRQPLLKVVDGKREYVIYPDGSISGFGENAIVLNYYPNFLRQALIEERLQRGKQGLEEQARKRGPLF